MTEPPFSFVLVVSVTLRITKRRPRSTQKSEKLYDSRGFRRSPQPITGRATGTSDLLDTNIVVAKPSVHIDGRLGDALDNHVDALLLGHLAKLPQR